jgi:hypothetical protein
MLLSNLQDTREEGKGKERKEHKGEKERWEEEMGIK